MNIYDYFNQVIYMNNQVIQAMDRIVEKSDHPPIIIQAGHVPGAYLDWNSVENTCIKERFSTLNAYCFPDNKVGLLNENITPVNTFRIVLNAYFGTEFDLLVNMRYFSSRDQHYNFIDVLTDVQSDAIYHREWPCTISYRLHQHHQQFVMTR
jgi:hypothetical protein